MVPIYHLFLFTGTPDLKPYGIRDDVVFAGHYELFPRVDGKPDASGWIDEERVRRLLHLERPAGTPVFLNLESPEWETFKVADSKIKFRPKGMDWRLRLLAFCRGVNPDLRYGYYKQPGGWGGVVLERPNEWHEYVWQVAPLLKQQDICIPQFYFNRENQQWPAGLEDALLWCERHFVALEFYAPGTPVWPVLWPQWYDLWRQNPEQQNTPEHRDKCAMPSHVFRVLLDYVLPRSDGLFLWGGQGGAPWDHAADWWRVLSTSIQEKQSWAPPAGRAGRPTGDPRRDGPIRGKELGR